MYIKIEYFQKRQAENPNFFYARQLDVDNAMRTLFWVDGRTQLLLFGKHATQKKNFYLVRIGLISLSICKQKGHTLVTRSRSRHRNGDGDIMDEVL
jgi:hypothetical protein